MTDAILVLNAGSSSVKFAAFALERGEVVEPAVWRGQVERIGNEPHFLAKDAHGQTCAEHSLDAVADHHAAIDFILRWVRAEQSSLRWAGVGHRVVHGGQRNRPARIDQTLLAELERLIPLAPQHQPHHVSAIRAVSGLLPELPQFACFDTSFHATQPSLARMLPLPAEYRKQGMERFGFHGLSYEHVVYALTRSKQLPARLVVAHLGNGASLCAIQDGRSVATTMGFTPLDGLLMGTRCGSIDPGALLYLMRNFHLDVDDLTELLYKRAGLLGVSGISGDMRTLLESESRDADQAVALFCYTAVRMIGSMVAALGGLDGLVFTGGIGEHAAAVRARICEQLEWLGLAFDHGANERAEPRISRQHSEVTARIVPANEEFTIARHCRKLLDLE